MEAAISKPSIYIEISSDEDSSSEDDTSLGLGDGHGISINLFEKFLHKSALFGITDNDVRKIRNVFRNASADFRSGDFVPFICGVLVRIRKENARQIMREVDQCLREEKISYMSPHCSRPVTLPLSLSQTNTSPRTLSSDVEDAKRKLIEFFNSQANKKSRDHNHLDTSQQGVSTQESIVTNGKCSPLGCLVRAKSNVRRNGIHTPNTGPPDNSREVDNETYERRQCCDSHGINKEKSSMLNDTDQHHIITSSILYGTESTSDQAKPVNDDCKNYMDCSNSKCNEETGNDDDNDIIIVSVVEHKITDNSHPTVFPSGSASRLSSSQVTETDISPVIEDREQRRQLLIKSIKRRLAFYDREIKRLMEAELTLDEMDSENSSYILESKLKDRYSRLFRKLCKLQGSKHILNGSQYLRIKIEGSPYPEINREAEKYLKHKKKFPDFFDIKSVVGNTNKTYMLGLKPQEEADVAEEVFSEIGNKLQMKRKREFTKYSGSFLTDRATDLEDPALNDHNLRKKLKRNKKISKSNTEKLFKHYSKLQYRGCENDHSSNDEEVEKAMLRKQKKLLPMEVEHCKTESKVRLEPDTPHGGILSNAENRASPPSSTCREMILSNSTVNDTLLEPGTNIGVCKVKNLKWEGNSCHPKNIGGFYDQLSIDNAPSDSSIVEMSDDKLRNYNGNCTEVNCKTEGMLEHRDRLQTVKKEAREETVGNFDIAIGLINTLNKGCIPKSDTTSSSIIVIDSDDD